MTHFQKYLSILLTAAAILTLTGCGEPVQITQPAYSLTIEQLASHLGLTVKTAGQPYYELTNANNRVLLFTYDSGKVYVNGKQIGPTNATVSANGTTYVSQLLTSTIRGHLKTYPSSTPSWQPAGRSASGTVVIDPGHGGRDPGAKSVLGYWEKTVNLQISNKVVNHLRNSGIDVVMTREGDSYPDLEERAALANRIGADLFVSIHCNTISSNSHRGFIVFVARSASWTSKKTARNIADNLSGAGVPSRGIQNQDFRVLVKTKCPAVLIECGFMTHYEEADLLDDGWYQDKLARAIANGIIESL